MAVPTDLTTTGLHPVDVNKLRHIIKFTAAEKIPNALWDYFSHVLPTYNDEDVLMVKYLMMEATKRTDIDATLLRRIEIMLTLKTGTPSLDYIHALQDRDAEFFIIMNKANIRPSELGIEDSEIKKEIQAFVSNHDPSLRSLTAHLSIFRKLYINLLLSHLEPWHPSRHHSTCNNRQLDGIRTILLIRQCFGTILDKIPNELIHQIFVFYAIYEPKRPSYTLGNITFI